MEKYKKMTICSNKAVLGCKKPGTAFSYFLPSLSNASSKVSDEVMSIWKPELSTLITHSR